MEKDKVEKPMFDEKDIKAIQEDMNKAKAKLVSKEAQEQIQQAKQDARQEAEKEFVTNQKIKELEEKNAALANEKLASEKEFAEKFSKMNEKVNELIGSKQPIQAENPFKANESKGPDSFGRDVTHLTDDAIDKIEKKSAEMFLGEDYNRPI